MNRAKIAGRQGFSNCTIFATEITKQCLMMPVKCEIRSIYYIREYKLTDLYLGYEHPVDDILRLLSLAINLQKLSFAGWCPQLRDTTLNPLTIIHQNLAALHISFYTYQRQLSLPIRSFLFRHLILPTLSAICIGVCGPIKLASFTDLQSRSGFSF